MIRKILEVVLFVVVFLVVPIVVGAIVQNFWGNWTYSVLAGVGTWFLFAVLVLIVGSRKAETTKKDI